MDIRLVNLTKIFADKNSEVRAVDNLSIKLLQNTLKYYKIFQGKFVIY